MKPSLLEKETPELWNDYFSLAEKASSDGAISAKMKELVMVALSIALRCEPCLKVHLKRAMKLGATKAEIAETLAVTLLMNGGPADVWSREIIAEVLGE
ncbi:MAG: carboxymuconolactone decarboxylase family protein [candidate division WOR-3 bacterium]